LDRMKYSWTDTISTPVITTAVKAEPRSDLMVSRSGGALTITFTALQRGGALLKIFGPNGSVVKTIPLRTVTGSVCSCALNVAGMPNGVYLVSLEKEGRAFDRSKVLLIR
jgi:hypothetical protein